jgi:hypothetical protein
MSRLVAVVEIARVPTGYPSVIFPFSSSEEVENKGKIHECGIKQEESLGKLIRERYFPVFKENFRYNSTVFVKNNELARESLKIQLNQIFESKIFNNFSLKTSEADLMMSPEENCLKLKGLLDKNIEKFKNHEIFLEIQNSSVVKSKVSNFSVQVLYELGSYLISAEERNASELDFSGFDVQTRELVKKVYHKYHEWLLYGTKEQGKLGLNEIFRTLNEFLKTTKKQGKYQRFLPYMMDQGLFLAALHLLGLDFSPKPPASAVFLEIHYVANQFKVRFRDFLSYIESEICGLECNLDDLAEHLSKQVSNLPIKKLCGLKNSDSTSEDHWSVKYFVLSAALLLIIFIAKYFISFEGLLNKNKSD